jgi:hypothetical protein
MSMPYLCAALILATALPILPPCVQPPLPEPQDNGDGDTSTPLQGQNPSDLFLQAELLGTSVSTGNGELQVALLWDELVDLDLLVVEPSGFTVGHPFFTSFRGDIGPSSPVTDGQLLRLDDDGFGPEVIEYNTVTAGDYLVFVFYFGRGAFMPEEAGGAGGGTGDTGDGGGGTGGGGTGGDGGGGPPGPGGGPEFKAKAFADEFKNAAQSTGQGIDLPSENDLLEEGVDPVVGPLVRFDVRVIFNGRVSYFEGTINAIGDQSSIATVSATRE